jgi:alkaline phosphatase D
MTRRDLVVSGVGFTLGAGIVGSTLRPSPAPATRHRHFQHGVASGDPLPDGVVLWTRVTPTPDATPGSGRGPSARVSWEVARDEDFAAVVAEGVATTDARRDHTVKLDVRSLEPATDHWFRFRHGPDTVVGRTRTAPAEDADEERLRLGVVCCANWQAGYFTPYRHLLDHDLDAVVHLGDYLYEYEPGEYSYGHGWTDVRRHDPPHETVSLEDYRRRHAQYKTDPDLQRLHAALPMIATWDDHEVADGWFPGGAFKHDPATEGPWGRRRAAALRAYDEWMPVRLSGTARVGDGTEVRRRFRFGRLADLSMLDLRGQRDERVEPGDPALADETRSIAGPEQEGWLGDGLETSGARWKLVGNPVMMAPVLMPPRPRGEELALRRTTDPTSWGTPLPNTDTWDGYPGARRRLLERLATRGVDDVLFLSGDVHTAWANEVEVGGVPVATELVCSSVTSNNVDDFMGTDPRTVSLAMEEAIQEMNPHVRFVNLDDHGFSVVELTREAARLEWHAVGDRRDPDASSRLLTARRVLSGSARVLPA